jgi:MFS family permease
MATISQPSQPIEKANYFHMLMDIAWFGLALAATTNFLRFFALDLGASAFDLGLIVSIPAFVIIFACMGSAWWRNRHRDSVRAVLLPGFIQRLGFFLPVFAPFMPAQFQVPWLIFSATVPVLGQGIAASVFTIMMRDTISDDKMRPLLAQRHIALNIAMFLSNAIAGFLLSVLPFPVNYQAMFLVAFAFAMVSEWHLTKLHVLNPQASEGKLKLRTYGELLHDKNFRTVAVMAFTIFFVFHVIVSVIPLQIRAIGADSGFIALMGNVEVMAGFLAVIKLEWLISRFGTRRLLVVSTFALGFAALVYAFSTNLVMIIIASALSGGFWSLTNVCLFSFLLERTRKDDIRAAEIYHQLLFLGIALAPMIGSSLAQAGVNLGAVLIFGAIIRFGGAFICEFGTRTNKKKLKPVNNE